MFLNWHQLKTALLFDLVVMFPNVYKDVLSLEKWYFLSTHSVPKYCVLHIQCHLIPNYYPPFHSCRNWGPIRLGKILNCSQLSNKSRFGTRVCLSVYHIFYSHCSMWPCPPMVCYLNDWPAVLTDGSFCTVVTYMMKQTFQMWLSVWTLRWGEHYGLSRRTQCNHMNLKSEELFQELARGTDVKTTKRV